MGKRVAGYIFDLFIVFVGVYLAFVATDYQEELRDRAVRVKYYEALILEFRGLVAHLDQEEAKLRRHLGVVEQIENGGQPRIPASDLYYVYPAVVVAAAVDGRNFESLDKEMLAKIIGGMPALTSLEERVRTINQLSATVLLPTQLARADCCYDEDGRLRPEFAWYPRLIREIHALNRELRDAVQDQAIPDLLSSRDELADGA